MKYVIYEMVCPSHLKEIENDGYYPKTIYREVLQELDLVGIGKEHKTMEGAINEITNKKDALKHMKLTVLPVFEISWDGELH